MNIITGPEIKGMNKLLNTVLLVDDDEPTNFLNRMVLEESGCAKEIVVMQNAREAVRYLSGAGQQYPLPELIFLDINMPAMDGWEFIKKYEELPVAQQERAVIIMLTTSFNPEDELKAMAIPAITGFRNKPLTAKMLEDILQQYF